MIISKLLDYIYPPRCPLCDRISPGGICGECRKKITYIREDYCLKCGKPLTDSRREYCDDCVKKKHAFTQGRALLSYAGAVKGSLYRLKYGNRREYAAVYGTELERELGRWIRQNRITLIVPVPLHRARRRKRGYNQAALLARSLGKCAGIPVDERLLCRMKRTSPLKTLSAQERKISLRDAFAVRYPVRTGERILLVDDIYTTGSTADAAARCLKQAGKCRIYVITVAIGG